MHIKENRRQWKESRDKRKKEEKNKKGETYLLLLKSDQLLLEVVNEGFHSLVFSVMFHGYQRGRRE